MRIRNKLLLYFSILSISLVGVAFYVIYSLFSAYRAEEFQQRIKDQTRTALKFLVEVKTLDYEMMQTIDRYTINNLYDEKITIYDKDKKLVYASLDDTEIDNAEPILEALSGSKKEISTIEEGSDIVGIFIEFEGDDYYGVAKAFDEFGLSKLRYLKFMLIFIYAVISTIILLTTYLLSKQISQPINRIADEISHISHEKQSNLISVPQTRDEIQLLATHFNSMMTRLNQAYTFQKHAIHHISHELKTPISVLVSNFEKMENEKDPETLREFMHTQKEDTKNLSDIINALLEMSKVDAGQQIGSENVRIDELIFDVIEEIKIIHPEFTFEVIFGDQISEVEDLSIKGNSKLLRLIFINLAMNCVRYSSTPRATFILDHAPRYAVVECVNSGEPIRNDEQEMIFQQFFRGENSKGTRGFGLGLMLISRIVDLHHGKISYSSENEQENRFKLELPLS